MLGSHLLMGVAMGVAEPKHFEDALAVAPGRKNNAAPTPIHWRVEYNAKLIQIVLLFLLCGSAMLKKLVEK
jgi:hypothetical protein